MRQSHRCTKCGVTDLLHLPETGHFGLFEAFICVDCGYTETYARKGARAKLTTMAGAKVLHGPREPGPYR